ncbi:MAG: MBL fold metallo-hydrolase [Candidatus Micrarchaeota archaeon]
MELHFLGGAGEVGRSCVSLSNEDTTIYLDCGSRMNEQTELPLFANAKRPDAVLLSHSHLDHCGSIPILYKHGSPKTYCTTPTLAVCDILYEDVLKIAKQEKLPAPFSQADLKKAHDHFAALGYENEFKLNNNLKFEFIDAGHIIGASQILVKTKNTNLLYSGDFKLKETRMHNGAKIEKNVDVLIVESTYGDKNQKERQDVETKFVNDVQEIVNDNGTALIPCFAVGRTQEVLSLLNASNFKGKIFIDGMGTRVNEIYYQYSGYLKNAAGFKAALQRLEVVTTREDKRDALSGGNAIICTAGMLEGGPVLSYLQALEKKETNGKIFLTGYQVNNTNGRRLLEGKPIVIKGKPRKLLRVSLPFKLYEFSAHADQQELLEYVEKVNAEKVICVHGDDTQYFAELLKEKGFNAVAPKNGERITV